MIELTSSYDRRPVWINPDQIVRVWESDGRTHIHMIDAITTSVVEDPDVVRLKVQRWNHDLMLGVHRP